MNSHRFIQLATTPSAPSADLRSPGPAGGCHQLLFASLYHPGRGVAVPCDAGGHVDLDALPQRLLDSYLGARAMIGREYAYPVVQRVH